jgi:N-acetylglucosamine-6-sulfatase
VTPFGSLRPTHVLGVLALCAAGCGSTSESAEAPRRPNVVLVVTDDQRADSLAYMPELNTAPEWARFTNAFVHEPQCCPSRASILTGRYSHHTRVETNGDGADLDEERTVATMLDDAGYHTGFYGKYLNGYPFERGHYVPPGWDEFAAYEGATEYFDYDLNENGTLVSRGSDPDEYSVDVLAAKGRRFIESTDASEPLFLLLALNAPHNASAGPPTPAPRHRGSCAGEAVGDPPNFNAYDRVSEPDWMRGETPRSSVDMTIYRTRTCEALRSVDEAVASIVAELERTGRLENTYLVFTSDNGFAFGEHRLFGKGDLYEPSVHVPLLARGPDVDTRTTDRLASNVDIAPTILDWADVAAPSHFVDGASFADELDGRPGGGGPRAVLLRGCRTMRGGDDACGGYPTDMPRNWGLRTPTHKYIEYPDGYIQLFDLTADPQELTNLAPDPAQAPLVADLGARLAALRRA